ncbi:MAG: septum site-determining protein Ssd [Propionibacteriaceae bacterium]
MVTADAELLDHALAVTASAGVEAAVIDDPLAARASWSAATIIIVGIDLAPRLLGLGLPRRPETYVVGPESRQHELAACSAPLGAAVVSLPESAGWLSGAVADVSGSRRDSRTVAVVGGVGGAGVSTLAAAVAGAGVRRRLSTFLVDADPLGGGLDVVLGAERVSGWRWSRLARAQGHVGDLRGHVLQVDGLDLLSHDREPAEVRPESMTAVLTSVGRSHALVVVDVGRHDLVGIGGAVVGQADRTMLVVPARVRAVAAAEQVLGRLTDLGAETELVVRAVRGGLEPSAVGHGLGRPVLGVVVDDADVRRSAERGEPPGRRAGSSLGRVAAELLDAVLPLDRDTRPRRGFGG